MKLKIELDHPDENYIWHVFMTFASSLPKEIRVNLKLELEGAERP